MKKRISTKTISYERPLFFHVRGYHKTWRVFVISIYISNNQAQISIAVVQKCSVKKVKLKTSQKSQENTCARASFLTKLQAWAWHWMPLTFVLNAVRSIYSSLVKSYFTILYFIYRNYIERDNSCLYQIKNYFVKYCYQR